MYTGLQRAELDSVVIDVEWITLTIAKQRKGMKEQSRSIPISPMLKRVLPSFSFIVKYRFFHFISTYYTESSFNNKLKIILYPSSLGCNPSFNVE